MGQAKSVADSVIPGTSDVLHMEVVRHAKVFSEISSISYADFKLSLDNLNALSRKCVGSEGKQMLFLVKSGTDTSVFWKVTVKIACVEVDLSTRKICSFNFLNLKQFLCVFNTFQSYLDSLVSSEKQKLLQQRSQLRQEESANLVCGPDLGGSAIMEQVNAIANNGAVGSSSGTTCSHLDHLDECSICLDRSTEVILPCAHSFCTPCIEQWNVKKKSCPICLEALDTTDDTWVLSNFPGEDEINDKIFTELGTLIKNTD